MSGIPHKILISSTILHNIMSLCNVMTKGALSEEKNFVSSVTL